MGPQAWESGRKEAGEPSGVFPGSRSGSGQGKVAGWPEEQPEQGEDPAHKQVLGKMRNPTSEHHQAQVSPQREARAPGIQLQPALRQSGVQMSGVIYGLKLKFMLFIMMFIKINPRPFLPCPSSWVWRGFRYITSSLCLAYLPYKI